MHIRHVGVINDFLLNVIKYWTQLAQLADCATWNSLISFEYHQLILLTAIIQFAIVAMRIYKSNKATISQHNCIL